MLIQKTNEIKKVDWTEVLRDRLLESPVDLTRPFTFREILGKPSAAVRAMVQGLTDKPVEIDMGTYGENIYREDIEEISKNLDLTEKETAVCFGCAATCTVLNILPQHKKNYARLYELSDLHLFEDLIDDLRRGHPFELLSYFLGPQKADDAYEDTFKEREDTYLLGNKYTADDLVPYLALADRLEELGY